MLGTPQESPMEQYVVLKYLAEGGMGAIYLGKKQGAGGFEKQVVLKQLLPEFTSQPEFIDLFLREARLTASLDHVNIVQTIDLVTAGDEYFIVMEYLDGADLRSLQKRAKRRRKRFSPASSVYTAREMLSALAYAHDKLSPAGTPLGLIHRDVSPSNILISRNGEVKLTDFGIAKASTHNSVFYRVKGKIGYMSPEQARGEPLDHRSDLYSLAVCLYEMVTGERLFVHTGVLSSIDAIYCQPVEAVSRKVDGVPVGLDEILFKALSIDPADRYQTASEFREALLRCGHQNGIMMSAPELADQMRLVCGPPNTWKNLEEVEEPTAGTEIFQEATEQIDASAISEFDELFSVVDVGGTARIVNEHESRLNRAATAMTNLSRLQGVALTSMIDAELSRGRTGELGAQPLIDLKTTRAKPPPLASPSASSSLPQASAESSHFPLQGRQSERVNGARQPVADSDRSNVLSATSSAAITATATNVERSFLTRAKKPFLVIVIMLLIGACIAMGIGLTGPRLEFAVDTAPTME